MSKPRVAIIGSCVTRDNFNSYFAPSYKEKVDVVASVYQSSLPSLAREYPIGMSIPEVTPMYEEVLGREYSGNNLRDLAESKPDFILLDGYADVQFGITKLSDQYVTRNHMIFATEQETNSFYDDTGAKIPERGRFGESLWYDEFALDSLIKLIERVRVSNKRVRFIVNSARFALKYTTFEGGEMGNYANAERLMHKNSHWDKFDNLVISHGANALLYPEPTFIGDEKHKWGLNPVHYSPAYYDYFWQQLDEQFET